MTSSQSDTKLSPKLILQRLSQAQLAIVVMLSSVAFAGTIVSGGGFW